MKKKFIAFCLSFLALAFLCFALFFYYSDRYIRSQVTFATYDDLTEKNVPFKDMQRTREIHTSCFEERYRKTLLAFYGESQNLDSAYSHEALKEVVEKQIEKERLWKKKNFAKEKTNVTLLRYQSNVIGLYTCAENNTITEGDILVWDVCLAENMRGKGIGHLLTEHAIKRCRVAGKELGLTVYKDDLAVIELYKKHGFEQIETRYSFEDTFHFYNKILMRYIEK